MSKFIKQGNSKQFFKNRLFSFIVFVFLFISLDEIVEVKKMGIKWPFRR